MSSISAWQPAHEGFCRCASSFSRVVIPVVLGRLVSTSGGGAGIVWQRSFSRTNLPRKVGELLLGCAISDRKAAWPRIPPRRLSAGSDALANPEAGGSDSPYKDARSAFTKV